MTDQNITPVIMPKWGLSMKEGKLTDWLIAEGTDIAVGDEIMEVETDKITNVVEASDPGKFRRRVAEEGETYLVRSLLGVLAPESVSDADVDAYIAAYEQPVAEDDGADDDAPKYEFADTSFGRLRYAVRGEDGPPVVLIHGFGGDLDNWLFNIDALAAEAKVYALDLPGHGQSAKAISEPGLDGLSNAVVAFMEEVGIDSAHLVGHSLGAAIASNIAVGSPARASSLTLIGAAGLGSEISSDYIDGFVAASSRRDLKPLLQSLFADQGLVTRSLVDDVLKYRRLDGVQAALSGLAASLFVGGVQQTVLSDKLPQADISSLIIWGKDDQIIPAAHASNLPGAEISIFEDAGHMVQMEKASAVNEAIAKHISG